MRTFVLTFLLYSLSFQAEAQDFTPKLAEKISDLGKQFNTIDSKRKAKLDTVAQFILKEKDNARLLFICTHNSRRSQMAQVWLSTSAEYYGIKKVVAFSGGTEATLFHPNAQAALERAGFYVSESPKGDNPAVTIKAGKDISPWLLFSKKYTHEQNPHKNFIAIMVCSDADKSCPIVDGANARVSLPYDDPRYFDGSPAQDSEYDKTSNLIALEMLYVMDQVKRKMILAQEESR